MCSEDSWEKEEEWFGWIGGTVTLSHVATKTKINYKAKPNNRIRFIDIINNSPWPLAQQKNPLFQPVSQSLNFCALKDMSSASPVDSTFSIQFYYLWRFFIISKLSVAAQRLNERRWTVLFYSFYHVQWRQNDNSRSRSRRRAIKWNWGKNCSGFMNFQCNTQRWWFKWTKREEEENGNLCTFTHQFLLLYYFISYYFSIQSNLMGLECERQ